jgi:hypothetical protein
MILDGFDIFKTIKRVFESVVVVAFQSAFHSEKYANNIFLFFKNHF